MLALAEPIVAAFRPWASKEKSNPAIIMRCATPTHMECQIALNQLSLASYSADVSPPTSRRRSAASFARWPR